jgi:hypothetical protein
MDLGTMNLSLSHLIRLFPFLISGKMGHDYL